MKRLNRIPFFIPLILWTLFPLGGLFGAVSVGSPSPGFKLSTNSGQQISLESFQGSYVLVHFWATWCPPCIEEFPVLEVLSRRYKSKPFTVLGISVDSGWPEINDFVRKFPRGLSFPIVLDSSKTIAKSFGTEKFPESFLIGPDGKVVETLIGPQDWLDEGWLDRLDRYVTSSLSKKIK